MQDPVCGKSCVLFCHLLSLLASQKLTFTSVLVLEIKDAHWYDALWLTETAGAAFCT